MSDAPCMGQRCRKYPGRLPALLLAIGLTALGCTEQGKMSKTSTSSGTSSGTAMESTKPEMKMDDSMPKEADMTHEVMSEQPYFMSMPAAPTAKGDGMMPAGSKVLVMVPGSTYSKVMMSNGKVGYMMTKYLEPVKRK